MTGGQGKLYFMYILFKKLFYFMIILLLLGTDSGRVVIWNFDTVLNEESEFNENIPKMLCQIDSHLGKLNTFYLNSDEIRSV